MAMGPLQHINIRCADAERSRAFYTDIMGLSVGARPPFASVGYWLYQGEEPIVHLVQKPAGETVKGPGTGNLDHIAFSGRDLAAFRNTLASAGVAFEERLVPRENVTQVFVTDPEGIRLELNFPAA